MAGFQLFGELSKIEDQDDGTIHVHGVASSGARDSAGEIITPEAMKAALPGYLAFGAVREMHGSTAAGTAVECTVDEEGLTRFVAHVVDEAAIKKVRTKVYKGFSVGGKVKARDPKDRSIITEIDLVEISLVDRPCNPEATIGLWKADLIEEPQGMTDQSGAVAAPSNDEVKARAADLAKAAGKPDRPQNFLVKARAELTAEAAAPAAPEADALAKTEVEPPAAETPPAAEPSPVNALQAALDKAAKAGNVEEPAAAPTHVTPDLADTGKGLAKLGALYADQPLVKGFYSISRLAEVIAAVVSLQSCEAWEANYEGDTTSKVPQALAEAVAQLGATLITMAQEEVAEAVADMKDMGAEVEIVVVDGGGDIALAAAAVDLAKSTLEKKGARNSKADADKIQGIHDHSQKLGAKCSADNCEKAAGADDLAKVAGERDAALEAIAKAAPLIEGFAKRLDDQAAEIAVLKAQPMPPKAAASALAVVEKGADSAGVTETPPVITDEAFAKALAELPEDQRGAVLMRIALSRPKALAA